MATNKRENILRAALHLFTERGYDATTIPMIADAAKVGAGTIYRHFENKEELLNYLFRECVQRVYETLTRNFPENEPARQQFHHIFNQLVRFGREDREALSFIDSHLYPRLLDEESQKRFVKLLDFIRQFLVRGQRQGIINPLPSDALMPIFYGAIVTLFETTKVGTLVETDELFAGVEECCWNAIRVH